MAVIAGAAAVAQIAMNLIAGGKAAEAAAEQMKAMNAEQVKAIAKYQEALETLQAQGIPSIKAQKIVLESPESVGLQEVHEQAQSGFKDITTDPRLEEAQMNALESMQQYGKAGATEGEKATRDMLRADASADEQARQKSILQDFEQKGQGDSGLALAARLSSSQSAANRNLRQQQQQAADISRRAMEGVAKGGAMAGDIRKQSFGEQAQIETAEDRIKRFNVGNRMVAGRGDLDRAQQISIAEAAAQNKQMIANKALIAARHAQEVARTGTIAGQQNVMGGAHERAADRIASQVVAQEPFLDHPIQEEA